MEASMNSFGSALLGYKDRLKHRLVIVDEREYDFGWVFFYNSKEFVDSGDFKHQLVGNAPLIFDRVDGQIYVTGTAHSLEHYIDEYRMEHDVMPNTALEPTATAPLVSTMI
jgi:hypothetical protein